MTPAEKAYLSWLRGPDAIAAIDVAFRDGYHAGLRAYKDVLLDRNELQRTAFDLTNKIFTAEMNLDQK